MNTVLPRPTPCRDCGRLLRFVRLNTGSILPVDLEPVPEGTVAARLTGGRLVGFVISRDHRPGPLESYRFVPHQATCPARQRPKTTPAPEDPSLF